MGRYDGKSVVDVGILELARTARILQRQLKIMRPLRLQPQDVRSISQILQQLEEEFEHFRL